MKRMLMMRRKRFFIVKNSIKKRRVSILFIDGISPLPLTNFWHDKYNLKITTRETEAKRRN